MRSAASALFKGTAIVVLGLFGTIGGSLAAVFLTPAGRGLAGRTLSEQLDQLVQGDIQVNAVGGAIWGGLEVEGLVLRDTAGATVLEADRLIAHYEPFDLLAGRIVLSDVTLLGPRVVLEKRRDGSWNVSRIFRARADTIGTGTPPLIRLERVLLREGAVKLIQPWDPPDSMRTPARAARALAEDRRREGRIIETGPEGYRKVTRFDGVGGRFALLQLSSPDREPLRAEFDSLAVIVSDPLIVLRTAEGTLEFSGDRLDLDLQHAVLPATTTMVKGGVSFVHGGPRFQIHAEASEVALRDLRGFVSGLPDLHGSARADLITRQDGRLAATVTDLDLDGRQGAVTGRLTAVTGDNRPLAFEDLDLTLRNMAPRVLDRWVDSIPLIGRMDGRVRANGPMTGLTLDADVVYRDDRVPGHPANRASVVGLVRFSETVGMVFDTLTVRQAELDLPTVTVLVPSNPLVGRASIEGTLQGPWQAFTWRGTAIHRDGDRPVSTVRGRVFLDIRGAVTEFDADLGLMPLALEGLAGTWPDLPAHGAVRGSVKAIGTPERFALTADVDGAPGHLVGGAVLRYAEGAWGADSLAFDFDSLDMAAFAGPRFRSQLLGSVRGHGSTDASGTPVGELDLRLGIGWMREIPIDSATFRVTADPVEVRVDTAVVRWAGGSASAGGSIARRAPGTGTLRIAVDAPDLGIFDSLVSTIVPPANDTASDLHPLAGRAAVAVTLSGGLDALVVDAHAEVREAAWRSWRVPSARGDVRIDAAASGELLVNAEVDTASWGGWIVRETAVGLRGRRDSLDWSVRGRLGPTDTVASAGSWARRGDVNAVEIDSLVAAMTAHTWRLAHRARASGRGTTWSVDSLVLLATDGSGELRIAGTVPGDAPGSVTVAALGLDLRDLAGIFQPDTIGILGRAAADLTISGTAAKPLLRGTFSLSEGGYREFRAPFMQGALDYADRRLQAGLVLWRTGKTALTIDGDLPVDLAFTPVSKRVVDGPLSVRAVADSADLGLLEAFTKNLRRVRGSMDADVTLTGRWGDTRFGGTVAVTDAAASLPGLGVRWEGMGARLHLTGDSVVIDTLYARGGIGSLGARGTVRFERRRPPRLDVFVRTDQFRAMDVRNYLTLVTTSRLEIHGPLFGATLSGRGRADAGALYFADLVTKQIVNLDDPTTAELIDTALVRSARLGPSFQNRFVDSLRISGFRLDVGEDFWLRSADANIKLSGTATVAKFARNYRLDGTLTAERGQYSLKLGFITRDFDVRRGTVRFLGTPDLNAELDLTATHHIKPQDGSAEIDLNASITGTLLVPRLSLVNPANPSQSETDIVAYLMFGRSAGGLQSAGTVDGIRQQAALGTAMNSYFIPALSSELERTLISDLGVPVDYIQIQSGGFGANAIDGSTSGLTTVTAGWQVGRQTYVAVNAGVCLNNAAELSYRNFGASLEQRLHRDWRAALSVEPVFTCSTAPGTTNLGTSTIYQLGLDLLWDREY